MGPNKQLVPLLIEIEFTGENRFIYLNNEELSSFPQEKEVLLQEGMQYKVTSVEK